MNTQKQRALAAVIAVCVVGLLVVSLFHPGPASAAPVLAGCNMFPDDHIWNVPIDTLPVDSHSADYINSIGTGGHLKADFGSGTWEGAIIGIPYIDVPGTQPMVPVTFDLYGDESDPGPYPIPADVPIEGGSDAHALIVDRDNCILYEMGNVYHAADGWHAGAGAVFDLNDYALRPETWTSTDAAGLPILPGLVRYDEVAAGEITHAIRFTANVTQRAYVWPARHFASSNTSPSVPPMGQRFRLKADVDISGFSPEVRVILQAMKTYGIILADNGSDWYVSGAPDERWDNDMLRELQSVAGSNFEAVDVSSLMIDGDSGQALTESPEDPVQIIFLHHSVGSALISQGSVRAGLTALGREFYDHGYNSQGLTLADGSSSGLNFAVPGDNTDPDGFADIFSQTLNNPPDNTFSYLMQYDVIVFKSCYPTSNITSDAQLEAYKDYYRTIRARADQYPGKIFIALTPPPQAPGSTNLDEGVRARAFADWLTSDEFLAGHPNLFTFDFFDLLADGDNFLRAEYQQSPTDGHPNLLANQTIGPLFVQFIDQTIRDNPPEEIVSPIYTDALEGGWENWSAGSVDVNYANGSPTHSGTASIAVTYTGAWSSLQIGDWDGVDISAYDTLRFWIHGGASGDQHIELRIGDIEQLVMPPANTWTQVDVSLADVGPSSIDAITWYNNSGGSQPTFYLDDIAFVGTGIVPPDITISGNAGVGGATLSYTDGSAMTATADGSGNYSFTVSNNWSGTVTPSLTGYTFTPASRDYANLTVDQTGQDYTAALVAPDVPVLVSPDNGSTTSDSTPAFDWEDAAGAAEYQIQVAGDDGFASLVIDTTTTASTYTPDTALANGTYYWHVRAGDGSAWSEYSEARTVTISALPSVPELLSPGNGTTTDDLTPTFDWSDVADVSYYYLQVSNNAGFAGLQINTWTMGSAYTPIPALESGTYYWRVKTRDTMNTWGNWSETWSVVLDGQLLPAPELVSPEDESTTNDLTPYFDWSEVAGASSYRLQIDDDADFSSPLWNYKAGTSAYAVGAPLVSGTYYWRVQTCDVTDSCGAYSISWSIVTGGELPPAPELLSPGDVTTTDDLTPTFDWSDVADVSYYYLQVSNNAGFAGLQINTWTVGSAYTPIPALESGTYYWRVKTRDTMNTWGNWSETWSVVLDGQLLPAPELVSPEDESTTNDLTPYFDWSEVAGASSYRLQIDDTADFSSPLWNYKAGTSAYTVGAPLVSGTYYWRVQTCDATDSCGAYSISWSIVTGGELPPAPALLSPANGATVADLTPTFDWSDVADVSYYYLQVSDNAGFVGLQINTWTVGSAYTPTTALESGTYYWRVKTRDTMNTWGDWSETWSVTLEGEPPAANLIIDSLSSVFGGTSIMPIYGVTTGQMADRTGFIGVKATI